MAISKKMKEFLKVNEKILIQKYGLHFYGLALDEKIDKKTLKEMEERIDKLELD